MVPNIPASHHDLLDRRVFVTMSTVLPDGTPHSSIVWVDYEGDFIRINTTIARQKYRDLKRNPHITLLWFDPDNEYRWLEVRGSVVEISEEGAVDHIHALSQKYENKQYYGGFAPLERASQETRVLVKITVDKALVSHH